MENARQIDPKRAELGDFLRSRRAILTPESVGLPAGSRRRTPGLRREEVAELAELSVALYTWLEQGREVPVSRRSIDAIAHALQLSPGEHRHLHYLASQEEIELREEITPALRRVVLSFRHTPVFVLDHAWDVVLRNVASVLVFGGDGGLEERFNLLETLFEESNLVTLFDDHDDIASSALAMFRLEFPTHSDEPRSHELVTRLRASNPRFEELWQRYSVMEYPQGVRRLSHPVAGPISFEPTLLGVVESPGLRMLLHTPADEDSAAAIERLVADYTASAFAQSAPSSSAMVRPA
jgi:transcriptional regulator with XRE-family HTH domain